MLNQAVIFCGGFGKRLMPITKKIPKPMAKVNGKPFLFHLIDLLDFIVLVNFIQKIFLHFQHLLNLNILFYYQPHFIFVNIYFS
jgi:D-glycero-alpha-D-manno-heptose 1-phosphate guanylyltransferase